MVVNQHTAAEQCQPVLFNPKGLPCGHPSCSVVDTKLKLTTLLTRNMPQDFLCATSSLSYLGVAAVMYKATMFCCGLGRCGGHVKCEFRKKIPRGSAVIPNQNLLLVSLGGDRRRKTEGPSCNLCVQPFRASSRTLYGNRAMNATGEEALEGFRESFGHLRRTSREVRRRKIPFDFWGGRSPVYNCPTWQRGAYPTTVIQGVGHRWFTHV